MAAEALVLYGTALLNWIPDIRPAQKGVAAFGSTRFQTISTPQESEGRRRRRRARL